MSQVTIDKDEKIIWHTPGFPADELVDLVKLYPGYSLHEYTEEENQEEEVRDFEPPLKPIPAWWQQPWYGVALPNTARDTVPPYIAWTPALVDKFTDNSF